MNVRHYFIGHVLNHEKNALKQASIKLVFNVIAISAVVMMVFACVYFVKLNYIQVIKSLVVGGLFISLLFYIRHYKSIDGACHMLMFIALINNILNIIFFGEFNFIVSLLTVTNILFAFHTLGSIVGVIYAVLHFLSVALYYILREVGYITTPTHAPMELAQFLISLTILALIITYLIYHYHKAYESARMVIEDSVDEMRKAKEMAEEMNRMKSNFLSSMSHEIRTPINGILGLSQIIELEATSDSIKEYVRLQKQSGERLLSTVGSILELSRLEAEQNNLTLKIVDINSIVGEVVQTLHQLAENKHIDLIFLPSEKSLASLSDDTLLYQVVTNIVGNAIKFTLRGKVEVRVGKFEEDTKYLFIDIEDTGIGISDEFKPRVFNPFEQESSGRSRIHEGTGLGLSISKRYIELLGGEIRLTSQKGIGSLFRILLPIYQP
jgi:signal transduction histidine kinase